MRDDVKVGVEMPTDKESGFHIIFQLKELPEC